MSPASDVISGVDVDGPETSASAPPKKPRTRTKKTKDVNSTATSDDGDVISGVDVAGPETSASAPPKKPRTRTKKTNDVASGVEVSDINTSPPAVDGDEKIIGRDISTPGLTAAPPKTKPRLRRKKCKWSANCGSDCARTKTTVESNGGTCAAAPVCNPGDGDCPVLTDFEDMAEAQPEVSDINTSPPAVDGGDEPIIGRDEYTAPLKSVQPKVKPKRRRKKCKWSAHCGSDCARTKTTVESNGGTCAAAPVCNPGDGDCPPANDAA